MRAVCVGREVAPRAGERRPKTPGVRSGIINIHLVRWIRISSSTAKHPHLAIYRYRTGLACRSRYVCDRGPRICHRIILVRVGTVGQCRSRDDRSTSGIDHSSDDRRRNVSVLHRQTRFKGPTRTSRLTGVKLPDIAEHCGGSDHERADGIELVIQDDKTTRQDITRRRRVTRPIISTR